MLKPRALRAGDRIGIVAPASSFAREAFDAGVDELRRLGYQPVFEDSVFARERYTAGDAALRASAFRRLRSSLSSSCRRRSFTRSSTLCQNFRK